MAALLGSEPDVVVSGTVDNQGPVLRPVRPPRAPERSAGRALGATAAPGDQPYGQSAEVAGYLRTVEPLLKDGATLELDGQRPPDELANAVEDLMRVTG
jgi:hypothetical protein